MIRAVLSVVIALVLTVIGHVMLWIGGVDVLTAANRFGGTQSGSVALASGGAILIGLAMATVAISSAGAIVLGAIDIVVGLIATVVPGIGVSVLAGQTLAPINRNLESGMGYALASGVTLVGGVVLLVGGLAAMKPTRGPLAVRITIPVADAAISAIPFVLLAVATGFGIYRLQTLTGPSVPGIAAMLGSALLLAAITISAKWTSIGVLVVGGFTLVLGVVGMLAIEQLYSASMEVFALSRELSIGLQILLGSGNLAMIGALLLGLGLAVGRRRVTS